MPGYSLYRRVLSESLNQPLRDDFHFRRHLVVRQEDQVGARGLGNLPQEMPRAAAGDRRHRRLWRSDLLLNAFQNVTDGLRRHGEMAILLAVLNGSLNSLLD